MSRSIRGLLIPSLNPFRSKETVKRETIPYNASNLFPWLLGMLLLTACAGLPPLKPIDKDAASETVSVCENAFPRGKWQFAHVIAATLPGDRQAQLIGVTQLSSEPERIHAVMMTVEGLVLFDAIFDGKLTINRGVAPFDSREFAEGLMNDIRLIFFRPAGKPMDAGLTEAGFQVCRYRVSDDEIVDVMVGSDGRIKIRKYHHGRLVCVVTFESNPIPDKIAFTAYAPAGYRLDLRLISAEQIND